MLQSHGQLKNRVLFLGAKNFPPGTRFDLCHKSGVDDDQLKLQLWPPVVVHNDHSIQKKLIKSANSRNNIALKVVDISLKGFVIAFSDL